MGWSAYYERHESRPCSPLLTKALAALRTHQRQAVDLGCGNGIETQAMLCHNWAVHAIDSEPEAIARVQKRHSDMAGAPSLLTTELTAFETLEHLPSADLVFAGFSLPFCRPEHFAKFWGLVTSSLRPGGVLAGQLFGVNDAWSDNKSMSFFTHADCLNLFATLELLQLQEADSMGTSMQGPKRWHLFEFVARKPVA
ncbi:MAG: methyltransferase domain-containing protein [Acidovorax sp.]|jgi:trans-aconitate methyltransferase|nr:methyltransferase domain-containing protein [Acidovorax sp.]